MTSMSLKQRAKDTHQRHERGPDDSEREEIGQNMALSILRQVLELDPDESPEGFDRRKDHEGWPAYVYADDGLEFIVRPHARVPNAPLPVYGVFLVTDDENEPQKCVTSIQDLGRLLD